MTEEHNPKEEDAEHGLTAYKAFDMDWKCRGMQYAVGQTFTHDGPVEACVSGLHACERPMDVLRYYRPGTSRFAVVRATGKISRHADDSKIAAASLTVEAEIGLPEIIAKSIAWTLARCNKTKGASSKENKTAVSASGDSGAATASGYSGAATASGDSGAATASGYYGAATASGEKTTASAPGRNGRARAPTGGAIFLVHRDSDSNIIHARASKVGENGIEPNVFYVLSEAGEFVRSDKR